MNSIEEIKREVLSRSNLVQEIRKDGHDLKRDGVHWVMRCPFHAEESPSFKIKDGEQHFHCYGCGAHGDIFDWSVNHAGRNGNKLCKKDFVMAVQAAAKRVGVEFEAKEEKPDKKTYTLEKLKACVAWQCSEHKDTLEDTYEYCNPDSLVIEHIIFRVRGSNGKKKILQAMPTEAGFVFGAPSEPRPIFNRSRIRDVQNVVIVEGENKVKALHKLGIVATCCSGGANAGLKADWSPLASKTLTFWRDYDEPGQKLQDEVISLLKQLEPAPEIYILDVTGLGLSEGEDCVDYISRLTGTEQERSSIVHGIISNAKSLGAFGELEREIEDAANGRRFNVPWTWFVTTQYTRALIPGSICIICGSGGSTKSFALIQNLRYWKNQGILAVALMLEDGLTFHLRRAFAQIVGKSSVTDDEWVKQNPDESRSLLALAKQELKDMEKYLEASSDPTAMTVEALLGWIEAKCREGCRVICIDPITAMIKGQFGFNDDFRFIMGAKKIIEKYRASLVLITHPRKAMQNAADKPNMDELSGGACYARFAHCIMALRALEEPAEVFVRRMGVLSSCQGNRTLTILKTRNARGKAAISLTFDETKLELIENGIPENPENA